MARPAIGERPMTGAERGRRHRDRRREGPPTRGPRVLDVFPPPPELPPGGFRVVYADPPWRWRAWSKRGEGRSPRYDVLATPIIAALPVRDWTNPRCSLLFVWATRAQLPDALLVMDKWGFRFKTVAFTWVKFNRADAEGRVRLDDVFTGTGKHTRSNSEYCLLGTRGSGFHRRSTDIPEAIATVYDRTHSQKPAEVARRIEALYAGPYVELFARHTRPGWTSWGNQVGALDGKAAAEPTP